MATQRFKVNPGEHNVNGQVVSEVGAAVNSKCVELTVDLAASFAYDAAGNLRAIKKQEVLDAIDEIKESIVHRAWPPA